MTSFHQCVVSSAVAQRSATARERKGPQSLP